MAGVILPGEGGSSLGHRDLKKLVAKAIAAILVLGVLAYAGIRVASQKRAPSGAKEASPLGPPAAPGLGELTVTCSPTLARPRGNVFSAALDLDSGRLWNYEALNAVRDELAALASLANPGFYVRVGTTKAYGGPNGGGKRSAAAEPVVDWRHAFESRSGAPRLDDLIELIRGAGGQPQIEIGYFARSASEAGALTAFLNGTDDSDPDVASRVKAGRADPLRIEAFELSHPPFPSLSAARGTAMVRQYAAEVRATAQAMRTRSPTPLRLIVPLGDVGEAEARSAMLGQLVEETKDFADGYSLSFVADATVPVSESAAILRRGTASVRRLLEERGLGKDVVLAIAPWDMSSFDKHNGTTWKMALVAAAGSVAASEGGASVASYPGIPSDFEDRAGYTYWPGADPERPSPVFEAMTVLTRGIHRELLDTQLTEAAMPSTGEEATPRPPVPRAGIEELLARCSKGEGMYSLAVLNLSSSPAFIDIKVGFDPGKRLTKTVLVAPLESSTVERSKNEFLSRAWFSDSVPPYSLTVWAFA